MTEILVEKGVRFPVILKRVPLALNRRQRLRIYRSIYADIYVGWHLFWLGHTAGCYILGPKPASPNTHRHRHCQSHHCYRYRYLNQRMLGLQRYKLKNFSTFDYNWKEIIFLISCLISCREMFPAQVAPQRADILIDSFPTPW